MKHKPITNNHKRTTGRRPLVSVVIPVFNGSQYLREAVVSVLKNTYKNIEILLVDDGSKDESKEMCRSLTRRYKNVRFFSFEKNRGLGRVLNFALKKAKGEFICRLNQDDRMLPHRIEKQVKYLIKHTDVVAVGSSIQLFNEVGKLEVIYFPQMDEDIRRLWLILSPFSDPSVMYRKSIAIRAGGYDQKFWPADDVHLWYRLGKFGKLTNMKQALSWIRWHENAASIKFFRIDTKRTFQLHLWADQYVQKAPWYISLFWVCQYIAGTTLSPQFNWLTYRLIKRILYQSTRILSRFRGTIINKVIPIKSVTPQPAIASRSGR